MRFQFRPKGPYHFERSMRFGTAPTLSLRPELFTPLLDYFVAGEYRRGIWVAGRPVLLRLRGTGGVERPLITAETFPEQLPAEAQAEAERAARAIVDADTDLRQFYAAMADEPRMVALTNAFRGLKVFRSPSLYESLVCAVLEQQVNFNFAAQLKAALVARYGSAIAFDGGSYPLFPRPERLARASVAELRELKFSGAKAAYIRGLSEVAAAGGFSVNGSVPQIHELLVHKGVGPWTANYVAIRVFGERDALPSNDVGLLKAAHRYLGMRPGVTPARLERRFRRFAGWRGYVTWYLWHTEWENPGAECGVKNRA